MHESDRRILNILYRIVCQIYRYSGLESICNKARVTEEQQPKRILPSLPLWLIGIYVVSFGVASQRYENRVDIIENQANTIYVQLAIPDPVTKGMAFRRLLKIQEMECPYKPKIMNPLTVYFSFTKKSKYEGVVDLMKETVENWKGSLESVDFRIDLKGYDLEGANLAKADLRNANHEEVNLARANLVGTIFGGANLTKANFQGANLTKATLLGAKLKGADFAGADIKGADLRAADLDVDGIKRARNWVLAFYDSKLCGELGLPAMHNKLIQENNLKGYNLEKANLWCHDFRRVNLMYANLRGAYLVGANLVGADLKGASLGRANLEKADFRGADLKGASLGGANLRGAYNLTIEQLSVVKTLYGAILDTELMKQVIEKYPHLFEKPKEEESKPDE